MLVVVLTLHTSLGAGQVTVWQSEAESGILSGTADIRSGCAFASGDMFVRMYADAGNSLSFQNAEALRTGEQILMIHYFYVGASALELFVNGVSAGTVAFPSASWCYQGPPALHSVYITLQEGTNEIEFRTTGGQPGPFIDQVLVMDEEMVREARAYYVSAADGNDSNSGMGPDAPWKSLEKVNNTVIVPGDTLLFHSGSVFSGQLRVNSSGTADAPIRISSYGEGDRPVINGADAVGGARESAVLINNQSFIEMRGLEITNDRKISRSGADDQVGYGIFVWNSGDAVMEHLQFRDLVIREVYAISTGGVEFNSLKVAGIYFRSERNREAGREKHIRDVLVDSCFITRTGKFGIWSQHGGGDPGVGNDSLNRNMNLVFRNNHTFETGGSGITPGRSYNCLVENNTFEYPGSDADPRMARRGSGAWFFGCRNVIAQYNTSLHVRGPADSYSMHIDYGNRNVILQYNYSEDSEGGFAEILGANVNSVYRFNVSVNDGIRDNKGNSIWISTYAGATNRVPSDSNYIYNNTIYLDRALSPDIAIDGKNTFIHNNIFATSGAGILGETVSVTTAPGGNLHMSGNLFFGNVNEDFTSLDAAPLFGDPLFAGPGTAVPEAFRLEEGSPARGSGITFSEPVFPMAGKGIFSQVQPVPDTDMFGNAVDLSGSSPNIGADNGDAQSQTRAGNLVSLHSGIFTLYPNPARESLVVSLEMQEPAHIRTGITDLAGRWVHSSRLNVQTGENRIRMQLPAGLQEGTYLLHLFHDGGHVSQPFQVY
ncbi:MAG: hypothetical protein RQ746_14410 [Bacteroidales bacterium]|nr:hypothetical protein [Bacteroidales bacterium]